MINRLNSYPYRLSFEEYLQIRLLLYDFHNKQYDKLTKKHKTLTNMIDNLYMDRLKGRIIEDEYFQTYFTAISFSI